MHTYTAHTLAPDLRMLQCNPEPLTATGHPIPRRYEVRRHCSAPAPPPPYPRHRTDAEFPLFHLDTSPVFCLFAPRHQSEIIESSRSNARPSPHEPHPLSHSPSKARSQGPAVESHVCRVPHLHPRPRRHCPPRAAGTGALPCISIHVYSKKSNEPRLACCANDPEPFYPTPNPRRLQHLTQSS